jgi:hypothetical protein
MNLRAQVLFKDGLHYRRSAFQHGISTLGYEIKTYISDPRPGDALVIWNRTLRSGMDAERFERAGATIIVAENGYLGKGWRGGNWFSLALDQVGGSGGRWPHHGPSRWDSFAVELAPWRQGGDEVVILGQRGIGARHLRSPEQWAEKMQERIGGRIRAHPGKHDPSVSLEDDLSRAACVVTWASSAALQALLMGVPAWHELPTWIGSRASNHISDWGKLPHRQDSGARLELFRTLAWSMWQLSEIDSGEAFRALLDKREHP